MSARKAAAAGYAAMMALALGSGAPAAAAASVHVAGLSLLMTSADVVESLRAQHIAVKTVLRSACVSDDLAMHRRVVPISAGAGTCVASIQSDYAGGSLLLFFTEDVPRRPGVSVLTTIALNYPTGRALLDRVIAEAGPPSLTDGKRPWTVAMWCFGFTCTNMERTLTDRFAGPLLLIHEGAGLTYEDAGAANRREDAIDRLLARRGVRRVP